MRMCRKCGNQFYPSRRDMRFCNVLCRVRYNNEVAKVMRRKMKRTNWAIMNNYRLLSNLLKGDERLTIPFSILQQKGFDVGSLTSIRQVRGETLFFLYDIAFKKGIDNQIEITKTN